MLLDDWNLIQPTCFHSTLSKGVKFGAVIQVYGVAGLFYASMSLSKDLWPQRSILSSFLSIAFASPELVELESSSLTCAKGLHLFWSSRTQHSSISSQAFPRRLISQPHDSSGILRTWKLRRTNNPSARRLSVPICHSLSLSDKCTHLSGWIVVLQLISTST